MISMSTTIAKRFTFDAAHHLDTMPEGHKCRRMHGHTYAVTIELRGRPDPKTGFFVDYGDIAEAWQPIHDQLDHRVLNEIEGLAIPTTEVLAVWIMERLWDQVKDASARNLPRHPMAFLHAVKVEESSTTWCRVTLHDLDAAYRDFRNKTDPARLDYTPTWR